MRYKDTGTQTRDILSQVLIHELWKPLGGGDLRPDGKYRFRGQAFWRDGDSWSIALDDARGIWYDHRDSRGGGILDLVVQAHAAADRAGAFRWVAEFAGVELKPLVPTDKAAWARE
jgi:hypothetical protein